MEDVDGRLRPRCERHQADFHLSDLADRAISAPTEIFVPVDRHDGGFCAVELIGPAEITSAPNDPLLTRVDTGYGLVTLPEPARAPC